VLRHILPRKPGVFAYAAALPICTIRWIFIGGVSLTKNVVSLPQHHSMRFRQRQARTALSVKIGLRNLNNIYNHLYKQLYLLRNVTLNV